MFSTYMFSNFFCIMWLIIIFVVKTDSKSLNIFPFIIKYINYNEKLNLYSKTLISVPKSKIRTAVNRNLIKKHIIVLGDVLIDPMVKYIHGNAGKGTFTFLGGHDPEDYRHLVGDPATDLSLHRNSPGYRLILNNILFPSARKKDRKT